MKNATAGTWKSFIEGRDHTSGGNFIQAGIAYFEIDGARSDDYDFIANAKQDIPFLINEIRRLNDVNFKKLQDNTQKKNSIEFFFL